MTWLHPRYWVYKASHEAVAQVSRTLMHVPWRCTTPLRLSWSKGSCLFFGINCPEGFFVHVCNGCFAMIIVHSRFALESSGCLSGGHTLVGMVVVPRQPNDVIVYPKMDSRFSTYFSALPKSLPQWLQVVSLYLWWDRFHLCNCCLASLGPFFWVRARPWAEWKKWNRIKAYGQEFHLGTYFRISEE